MAPELIPPAVRIAVTNAVGGWGPYSVREIHDLFNSYGFVELAQVPDAGGVRRTAAEQYHAVIDWTSREAARAYVDLVDEVLTHYPETSEDEIGQRLRRVLRRAGIRPDSSGRLQLPEAATEAAEALEAASEGIWTDERVRIFISHLSAHKVRVHAIAQELNRAAFSCFVAHDMIEPSRQWQDVIELALRTCDALVAYVTPGFRASAWCDQEVGWALGRGLIVIPVRAGEDPHGFFGAYQAVPAHDDQRPAEVATSIARGIAVAVFRQQRAGARRLIEPVAGAVIEAFCTSRSFETARRRFELIRLVPKAAWTDTRRKEVETALVENSQLREGQLKGGQPIPDAARALIQP
jgi:hypothetical protein